MTNATKGRLLIVGAGGFGRVVLEHALKEYDCAFVDDGYENDSEICGCKVIGKIAQLKDFRLEFSYLIISIGNTKIRERVYAQAKKLNFIFPNIICENVYISPFAQVGEGCVILNNVVIQNGAKIGNNNILNPGVEIHQDSSIGNHNCIYANTVVRTYAHVEDRVKIGSNVTISNKVRIKSDKEIEDGVTVKV